MRTTTRGGSIRWTGSLDERGGGGKERCHTGMREHVAV
jgi:hypothetical protein